MLGKNPIESVRSRRSLHVRLRLLRDFSTIRKRVDIADARDVARHARHSSPRFSYPPARPTRTLPSMNCTRCFALPPRTTTLPPGLGVEGFDDGLRFTVVVTNDVLPRTAPRGRYYRAATPPTLLLYRRRRAVNVYTSHRSFNQLRRRLTPSCADRLHHARSRFSVTCHRFSIFTSTPLSCWRR